MRILYAAMKYDYGDPRRGYSFEHYNFFDFFQSAGHEVLYFDFMDLTRTRNREYMNRRLLEIAQAEKPHLMFTVLFTDQFESSVIRQISDLAGVTTLNWFCDDHWRFDNYSKFWAPHFNWVVTTANSAIPKYKELQLRNVIKSQWGCNHLLYQKMDLPLKYDVTFVGQPYGNRRQMVHALRDRGVSVECFGYGWESGRVTQEEMIRIFNQSRINLNFSNAFLGGRTGIFGAGLDWITRSVFPAASPAHSEQIKGRNFEVPGCGGFLLTAKADDLESYYQPEKEVVCFDGIDELADKIKYYLANDQERRTIAERGYQRTLREHTYSQRFQQIFRTMGLLDG
jgi:spore maturation protein CgeB